MSDVTVEEHVDVIRKVNIVFLSIGTCRFGKHIVSINLSGGWEREREREGVRGGKKTKQSICKSRALKKGFKDETPLISRNLQTKYTSILSKCIYVRQMTATRLS